MSQETWYRGVSGRQVVKPGAFVHPLGEGTYYTDSEPVAWEYATTKWDRTSKTTDSRALKAASQNVYELNIKRQSLGRVLDLTKDARWRILLNTRIGNGSQTIESLVRQNTEMHHDVFQGFLKQHNIKPESYDAVVSEDYESGGKYLCVVTKNGLATRIGMRLSALMKPIKFRITRGLSMKKLIGFVSPVRGTAKTIPFRTSKFASKSMRTVTDRNLLLRPTAHQSPSVRG